MLVFEFTKREESNFWSNVIKTYRADGSEYCWLWKGKINKNGYGIFNSSNTKFAHRFSVQLHGKSIPEKLEVNHKCNTRNCVNPKHLNIITHKENLRLRGQEQNLDAEDQTYEKEKPLTKFQRCVQELENIFLSDEHNVIDKNRETVGNQAIIAMIKIKMSQPLNIFNMKLDWNQTIEGYKRKSFWIIDTVLKRHDVCLESIINHYKIK